MSREAGMEAAEVRAFLSGVFGCADDVAAEIAAAGRLIAVAPRAVILSQRDATGAAFVLILGRAQALLYGADGQLVLLYEFGPGDLFGHLGPLDPAPDEAEVVAVDRVEMFTLRGAELVRFAERHSAIGIALTRLLLKRLRRTTTRIYERAALSANGRVFAELLRLACDAPGGAMKPPPVVSELAVRASTTRETASRAISMLERRGIVIREPGVLKLVAPHRLEELIL
ncbi:MAG: Crp/Fnr family transcriptional regulator [Allosphingosinicella sp.]|uniref:Crp/Fnr family transcriptional regulator n=1 Tax=Allosphingosinicella sp. TaxID=2823234 RepID=UPI003938B990